MCKSLQTDRQTDGWTDNGRRAIALAHSWNELKMTAKELDPMMTWSLLILLVYHIHYFIVNLSVGDVYTMRIRHLKSKSLKMTLQTKTKLKVTLAKLLEIRVY